MSKEYKLKLMTDMFQIPPERFEEFLIDLRQWHKVGGSFADLIKVSAEIVGQPVPEQFMLMHWIDDGKHGGKVQIKVTSEEPKK